MAVKLTPLGAFSLTSRAAAGASAVARRAQSGALTCGSVVEVFVDKLARVKSATASVRSFVDTAYVVGGLGDVAEGRRREPGDDLLDLDVLGRHNGGVWKKMVSSGGVFVVVLAGAKFSRQKTHTQMNSGSGPR